MNCPFNVTSKVESVTSEMMSFLAGERAFPFLSMTCRTLGKKSHRQLFVKIANFIFSVLRQLYKQDDTHSHPNAERSNWSSGSKSWSKKQKQTLTNQKKTMKEARTSSPSITSALHVWHRRTLCFTIIYYILTTGEGRGRGGAGVQRD